MLATTLIRKGTARHPICCSFFVIGYDNELHGTESFEFGEQLSATAQRGIDKALQTIERFLIHYQAPYRAAS